MLSQNMLSQNMYYMYKLHMLVLLLVIVGGINWGTTAFGYNLVEMLSNFVNNMFNRNLYLDKIIYVIVMLAAIKLAMHKTSWLPFLGDAVLPSSLLPLRTPTNPTLNITISTRPNSKIAYWAALPSKTMQSVEKAYADFSNSGVVMSNNMGIAILPIIEGSGYIVRGKELKRHLHYRVLGEDGMMSKVKTVKY